MDTRDQIERVPTLTPDTVSERSEALRALIPEAFSEGKIDFSKLREALGDEIDDRPERYSFSWAGKRDAIRLLQAQSQATLQPVPEESVNWDTTENVFIEGDNLEVLKLLYKPYFGRIKMIYIDPPYNTGNDFIYPDDYAHPLDTYLELTAQKDVDGNLMTSNPETGGRYHSAWLSMMFPRLFLARQLLREDGMLFVSIDDHEFHGLRMLLNEVFGEENFLATFVRKRRMPTGMRGEPLSPDHEYVLSFARDKKSVVLFGRQRVESDYPLEDSISKFASTDLTIGMPRTKRPNQYYPISNPRTGVEYPPSEARVWRFEPGEMQSQIRAGNIIFPDDHPELDMTRPRFKTRYDPSAAEQKTNPVSTWIDTKKSPSGGEDLFVISAGMNQDGTKELKQHFGAQVVEYPKPVSLIQALVELGTGSDDIVLDFFAGSGTTAEAVLRVNQESASNRKFICVQLPEPTPENSDARSEGYTTISEICRERIRRVIAAMETEQAGRLDVGSGAAGDLGFKAFALSPSHFRPWREMPSSAAPAEYTSQLELLADPLMEGWEPVGVIYEVALREGLSLASHMESELCPEVWRITDEVKGQSILVSLSESLDLDSIRSLGLRKEDTLVCRDVALSDTVAANLALQCRLKTI